MKLAKTALATLLTFTVPGLRANAVLADTPPATSCSALIQDLVNWEKQDSRNHVDFLMVSNKKSSKYATYTEGQLDFQSVPFLGNRLIGLGKQYFSDRLFTFDQPAEGEIVVPTHPFDPEKTETLSLHIVPGNGQISLFKTGTNTKGFDPQCSNGLMSGFTDTSTPGDPQMYVISFKKVQDSPPPK